MTLPIQGKPRGSKAATAKAPPAAVKPSPKSAPKPNKFNAVKTTAGGLVFDSKGESQRYADLLLLQKAGQISGLKRQVPFRLEAGGQLICIYRSDFSYVEGGREIVEDFKSPATVTDLFKLKRRLMQVLLGIDIRVTMATKRGRKSGHPDNRTA